MLVWLELPSWKPTKSEWFWKWQWCPDNVGPKSLHEALGQDDTELPHAGVRDIIETNENDDLEGDDGDDEGVQKVENVPHEGTQATAAQ